MSLSDESVLERANQLSQLTEKVKHYEDILQASLADVTRTVEQAQAEALMTMLTTVG